MVNTTLHYFYDPLCGWCYAASPLLQAAAALPGLNLALHAGGMMSGSRRQAVTPALRDYVMPHDQRIASITGLLFGDAYFDGLLRDGSAIFDSTPPIAAILAAEKLGLVALAMLSALQRAHYQRGLRIADTLVLRMIAQEQGLDPAGFAVELERQLSLAELHIQDSRHLMQQYGMQGFPSLLLERDGQLQRVDVSPWLGQPQAFTAALQGVLGSGEATEASLCTADGCGLPG
ncbi:DsbA family protein [Aquitalea denitrificans]|uniref:DsbA family protein n=1 Tax=Aquitalea denitrificans TaxID=519081 RepID=UPI001357AA2B|nr:DsbA family protein [Aquitalea denitrificans]